MEINKNSYKFKICISLEEYTRALYFFESFIQLIDELSIEYVDLIRRLKKGLLKNYRKYLTNLKKVKEEENFRTNKYALKTVYEEYSVGLKSEAINIIESFINCVNNLINKTKESRIIAFLSIIRAKLFTFLLDFNVEDNKNYLQLAYGNYKKAVEICIKNLNKKDILRMKIFYSYCKFLLGPMKDKYRSVLFSINLIDELNSIKIDENENDSDDETNVSNKNEFVKLEKKIKLFYENNLADYNYSIRIYHPEYKL
jgi:hypothetical protein